MNEPEIVDRLRGQCEAAVRIGAVYVSVGTLDLQTLLAEIAGNQPGEIAVGIDAETGLVMFDLQKLTRRLTFDADQAERLGHALLTLAVRAEGKTVQ